MRFKFVFMLLLLLLSCIGQETKDTLVKQRIVKKNRSAEKPKNLKFKKIIDVGNGFKIAFKKYDSVSWYCDIYVIIKNIPHKIVYSEEYANEETCGFSENYTLSPNGKFVVVERIERGYLEDGKTKTLHENAFCWLINLEDFKLTQEFQSACGGEWNEKNEWVYGDDIKFSPN